MPVRTERVAPAPAEQLHRRALGVPGLVFFIVAASAPLTAIAGGQSVGYLVTGNRGMAFLYIPFAVVLALFAAGYAAMSQHVTNAGAFYAYVAQGLGRTAGVGTAFVALVSYNAMQIGIYGLFGVAMGTFMADNAGIDIAWWGWCLIALTVIAALGVLQVDLNAKVLAVLLVLEVVVVVIFDVAIAAEPGPQGLTATALDPSVAVTGALGAALAFIMASFVGFEAAAVYSEECRDPRRTVARSTFIAIASIAVLYTVSSWLLTVAAGPATITNPEALLQAGFTTPDGSAPDPTAVLFAAGGARVGETFADIAALLFATSLFAALLSFHNTVARYVFALGRERVLPAACARVQSRTGAPIVGSAAQTTLALAVIAIFAVTGEDPVLTLFTWLTNLGALGVILLLALASCAVVAFFLRHPAPERGRWSTLIAPALAGVLLSAVFAVVLLNFNVLITSEQDAPVDRLTVILPSVLLGAGVLGLLVGSIMRHRRPDDYALIGLGGAPRAAPPDPA